MGRNTYIGGSTIVNAGSGFFSHKGGPGKKRKKDDGRDKPGPPKPGSICDFGPLRRKPAATKATKSKKVARPATEGPVFHNKAVALIAQAKGIFRKSQEHVANLRKQLLRAEREMTAAAIVNDFAATVDLRGPDLVGEVKILGNLLTELNAMRPVKINKKNRK